MVLEDVAVDLPDERDQLTTRSCREFADNRGRVYELVQSAKKGSRPVAAG